MSYLLKYLLDQFLMSTNITITMTFNRIQLSVSTENFVRKWRCLYLFSLVSAGLCECIYNIYAHIYIHTHTHIHIKCLVEIWILWFPWSRITWSFEKFIEVCSFQLNFLHLLSSFSFQLERKEERYKRCKKFNWKNRSWICWLCSDRIIPLAAFSK